VLVCGNVWIFFFWFVVPRAGGVSMRFFAHVTKYV
jgi:hypothetical protein